MLRADGGYTAGMPNGKPGDHPVTDMFVYGAHPFPADIEERLRRLHQINPLLINDLGWKPNEWEQGRELAEARALLDEMLREHGA